MVFYYYILNSEISSHSCPIHPNDIPPILLTFHKNKKTDCIL